jgi:hypothetical protein
MERTCIAVLMRLTLAPATLLLGCSIGLLREPLKLSPALETIDWNGACIETVHSARDTEPARELQQAFSRGRNLTPRNCTPSTYPRITLKVKVERSLRYNAYGEGGVQYYASGASRMTVDLIVATLKGEVLRFEEGWDSSIIGATKRGYEHMETDLELAKRIGTYLGFFVNALKGPPQPLNGVYTDSGRLMQVTLTKQGMEIVGVVSKSPPNGLEFKEGSMILRIGDAASTVSSGRATMSGQILAQFMDGKARWDSASFDMVGGVLICKPANDGIPIRYFIAAHLLPISTPATSHN